MGALYHYVQYGWLPLGAGAHLCAIRRSMCICVYRIQLLYDILLCSDSSSTLRGLLLGIPSSTLPYAQDWQHRQDVIIEDCYTNDEHQQSGEVCVGALELR